MKRKLLTLILVALVTSLTYGQDNMSRFNKVMQVKEDYITKELMLTDSEKEKFLPLYREYCEKKLMAKKDLKNNYKTLSSSTSAHDVLNSEQAILDIEKEYVAKFKTVIPEVKVSQLFIAEKKFKNILLEKLKERKQSR